jgi:hypothetical protein
MSKIMYHSGTSNSIISNLDNHRILETEVTLSYKFNPDKKQGYKLKRIHGMKRECVNYNMNTFFDYECTLLTEHT